MQTNFVVKFRTVKQIQSGNDKETLDILVYDNGTERAIETYSGGERTLINLSVRLSLSKVLASIYNVEVRAIFLDEVLSALDEVNETETIKVLKFLSNSFSQLFVISHTERVRDYIPNNIIVTRHQEYSEVKVK
jgi:exonuclease SbcC